MHTQFHLQNSLITVINVTIIQLIIDTLKAGADLYSGVLLTASALAEQQIMCAECLASHPFMHALFIAVESIVQGAAAAF